MHRRSPPPMHWLRDTTTGNDVFRAKVPSPEIACGVSMTAEQMHERTTRVSKDVTCPKCKAIAKRVAAQEATS